MENLSFMFILLLLLCHYSYAIHTITSSQSLDNGTTLVSRSGIFELGFFSPGNSNNRYVGIWYRNIPVRTVFWVANRLNPINDSSGFLTIDSTGNLVLVGNKSAVLWSTNSTTRARTPIVQLLDSGNLVLRDEQDGDAENFLWQSFDYPSDTLLPGMKLGMDLKKGLERRVIAWKNWDDPSPGDFSWQVQLHNNPELAVWKGSKIYCRSGPWNGITFSGTTQLRANPFFTFEFVRNKEEVYYVYHQKDSSEISRLVMNQTNSRRERFSWNNQNQSWLLYTSWPIDYCDQYGLCGAYGNCIITESPVCQCLKGFTPKSPEKWNSADWSEGCVRNKSLDCKTGDGFKKFTGLKLPDTMYSWINDAMDLEECRVKCSENCSCTAYANLDVRGRGSGCAIWFNDLIDIRQMSSGGQDLYIRMSASELDDATEPDKKIIVVIVTVLAGFSTALIATLYFCKIRRRFQDKEAKTNECDNSKTVSEEELDLPLIDLDNITNATDNFSVYNKIGEGGFGLVYKGKLADGQEIAVKRLSTDLGQGIEEFKNEVMLISNLQHRNLVKLLGCCIQGDEKMLVYEYMPNKSLDFFIFDCTNSKLLDWCKRFNIIEGIARGLLYLHQDSRLRIIHRDLKASNVLLDSEMNPKISDFGIAKTFGGDQTEGNTNRVMGTFGYMAPEYATDGLFSVKSDVFSFGILILEIICGKRSRGFYHPDDCLNLVGYAWRVWKEGKPLELIDTILSDSCDESQVTRCIHISLLCVQQNPEDRPSTANVVLMLGSEITLPNPKEPGFFKDKGPFESLSLFSFASSETTTSLLVGR